MSGLWTPSGDDVPDSQPREVPADPDQPDHERELARVRAELAAPPVVDIVANHAVGLWQLALLHLDPQANSQPRLDEARLAIDALGALVEGLGDQLGPHAAPLRDALAQLRMVFVQVQGQHSSS